MIPINALARRIVWMFPIFKKSGFMNEKIALNRMSAKKVQVSLDDPR
jgi:hypothetical protein